MYNLKAKYFETGFDRASVPELQELLRFPGDTGYPPLAPVIFANNKCDTSMKNIFKNPVLVGVSFFI